MIFRIFYLQVWRKEFNYLKRIIRKKQQKCQKQKSKNIIKTRKNKKFEILERIFNYDKTIERIGFIIVCDLSELQTYEDVILY